MFNPYKLHKIECLQVSLEDETLVTIIKSGFSNSKFYSIILETPYDSPIRYKFLPIQDITNLLECSLNTILEAFKP